MLTLLNVLVLLSSLSVVFPFPEDSPVVTTRVGNIRGKFETVVFDNRTYHMAKFLGIPYAEPPIGHLRFRKPNPLRAFPSTYNATSYGPMCPQLTFGSIQIPMSENCLFLNVIVPPSSDRQGGIDKKPVIVFIHGGAFVVGSSTLYDVDVLSAFNDVIIVSMNYRLGALGFFSTNDIEAAGNYGLWDQREALRWVHDNIEAFGGDSQQVTIFGESAGSSSVVFQSTYPGNRRLFQRAIAESGTITGWAVLPKGLLYNNSMDFAFSAGCPTHNHKLLMECLREIPSETLLPIVAKSGTAGFPYNTWVPAFDNDFVTVDPFKILRGNNTDRRNTDLTFFHDVDLLIGWNRYDCAVYLLPWLGYFNITSLSDFNVTGDQFRQYYVPNVAEESLQSVPNDVVKAAVRKEYDSKGIVSNLIKATMDMCTDAALAAPTVLTASVHSSNTSNTYVYRFAAKPPLRIIGIPPVLDSPTASSHGDELPFVFGLDAFEKNFVPDPSKIPKATPNQLELSKTVMSMWGNFAKTGNPNGAECGEGPFNVEWPPFTTTTPDYLEITFNMSQSSVKSSKDLTGVNFWNVVVPGLQKE